MKKITVAIIGAGARGMHAYAPYFKQHEELGKVVAVAEPHDIRRDICIKEHNIDSKNVFETWEDLLEKDKLADAIIIANNDEAHYEPTKMALEKGYHVLLEKPMSNKLEDIVKLGELAKQYPNQVFMICHVLRYTTFFSKLKEIVDSKELGELVSIQHNENIGYWHFAHSFTRGNWRNSNETSPLILAKSCHDMDILLWLTGKQCTNLSAFGHLTHMRDESFKDGMAERCLDCNVEERCPYSAKKLYLSEKPIFAKVVHPVPTKENLEKALRTGPYGRCVYKCDNNVVDHMVTILEFEDDVTATFNLSAFTEECNRTIKLMFTHGEVGGNHVKNTIEIKKFENFGKNTIETIIPEEVEGGHGGGDYGIMQDFVSLVAANGGEGRTSATKSVESHIMAFAAEHSRLNKEVVNIDDFWSKAIKKLQVNA
ncbi:MAG: Gfo/Idh/MocA family protein [Paraclostridium sp.]|uniref:Gfo/Idh/MocA family protein n=1 Tax=Paraclostridium sp. TaxID=2023273 RepID=UPI003F3FCD06